MFRRLGAKSSNLQISNASETASLTVTKYLFPRFSATIACLCPIKNGDYENSTAYKNISVFFDRCWPFAISHMLSSSRLHARPCDNDFLSPGFLQVECVLRAFENLSDLSLMMNYSLAPGSCSNVLRSRCLLRRFSMFAPSISTTLPSKKESSSTSSVRSRKFPSRTSSIYLVRDPTPTA